MKKVITLFALAITALSFNASAQRAGEFTISQKEVTAEDFTNWFVSYDASLDNFDKGSYGIGWVTYGENGFGATMSAHGSWGLVDPGSLMFQFGPVYGYPVTEHVLVGAQLKGFLMTYENVNSDLKIGGGMYLMPNVALRTGKLSLTVGYNLGWGKSSGDVKFGHNLHLAIGYNF